MMCNKFFDWNAKGSIKVSDYSIGSAFGGGGGALVAKPQTRRRENLIIFNNNNQKILLNIIEG